MTPLREARTYLRNTLAASPNFGDRWEVVNIENTSEGTLVLDLDDGRSIRLDITVYDTEMWSAGLISEQVFHKLVTDYALIRNTVTVLKRRVDTPDKGCNV